MIAPVFRQQQRLLALALQTRTETQRAGRGFFSKTLEVHTTSASQPPRVKVQQAGTLPRPSPRDCHALARGGRWGLWAWLETTPEPRRAQAWLGTLLPLRSSLRKRTEASDPGRVGAISRHWSPEGPLSTLIIYEVLPPSGVIRKRKKQRWGRRKRRNVKSCVEGGGRSPEDWRLQMALRGSDAGGGCSKEGSESTWRAFMRGAKVSSYWFACRWVGGSMSPQPGCWQDPARVCGEREAACPCSFTLMFTCSLLS